jgi:3-hydroxybutyryl-CoA dehydratase
MLQEGDTDSWERTFTEDDVRLFGQLSGDRGEHHMQPDAKGRIMVHGLLTATLPTKLGGDWNYIAREMTFEFLRPVFVGDTIRCETRIERLEQSSAGYLQMAATYVCRNQHGKDVLSGRTHGVIRNTKE